MIDLLFNPYLLGIAGLTAGVGSLFIWGPFGQRGKNPDPNRKC